MEKPEYTRKLLEKLDPDFKAVCEDCGKTDLIGHALVDHATNTVKVVCHTCFETKYLDWFYKN